ncbi:hypothetical protein [Bauldia litoralis]|uniref:PH domain-containing protein n=1 Tax=Bauldia litoralis TaxID=665467 RepID=A0A1G6CP28_9HYPH|nr:hypothetical protein [Bauldia litoralis]SDB34604.1 hypothetical protein SAMN02982931_02558 [Bauldia litoralis]
MAIQGASAPVTIFRNRPRVLLLFVVLALIFIVQGIATAGYFAFFDDGAGFQFAGIGLALFVILIGVLFGGYALIRIRDRHAPIAIDSNGLQDQIISSRPIPWSDIRNLRIFPSPRGGPSIVFDLAETAEIQAGVYRRALIEAGLNRAAGGYSYHLHPAGTDASIESLIAAIRPFAAIDGA